MRKRAAWVMIAMCFSVGQTLRSQQPQHGDKHPGGQDKHPSGQKVGDLPGGQKAGDLPHMEHRFDNAAELAKAFDDPARDAWQMPGRVIEALNLKPGEVVADIGAGTGYFTVRLAKAPASPKVYAVDVEASMVDYVRQRAVKEGLQNVVAVRAASDKTNLPEPVDVVLIVNTYHHLPSRPAYFAGLKKLLKPSARLAIVDFKKGAPGGPPDHFRFTPDQITGELGQAGFALQTEHDFLPRQIFLVYRAI